MIGFAGAAGQGMIRPEGPRQRKVWSDFPKKRDDDLT